MSVCVCLVYMNVCLKEKLRGVKNFKRVFEQKVFPIKCSTLEVVRAPLTGPQGEILVKKRQK